MKDLYNLSPCSLTNAQKLFDKYNNICLNLQKQFFLIFNFNIFLSECKKCNSNYLLTTRNNHFIAKHLPNKNMKQGFFHSLKSLLKAQREQQILFINFLSYFVLCKTYLNIQYQGDASEMHFLKRVAWMLLVELMRRFFGYLFYYVTLNENFEKFIFLFFVHHLKIKGAARYQSICFFFNV